MLDPDMHALAKNNRSYKYTCLQIENSLEPEKELCPLKHDMYTYMHISLLKIETSRNGKCLKIEKCLLQR
jgi:hypothetical protein